MLVLNGISPKRQINDAADWPEAIGPSADRLNKVHPNGQQTVTTANHFHLELKEKPTFTFDLVQKFKNCV